MPAMGGLTNPVTPRHAQLSLMPTVKYHCLCLSSPGEQPPPANLVSSSSSFHDLSDLYFCEECDAVRCSNCVFVEVSGYYCPNCLFEVPSASVRAEKNRCARNCFQCPHCRNTLSVVPSDPPDMEWDTKANPPQLGALNDPPFLLYCNSCRWDSAEIGITFEKSTGLAVQMQKYEDSAPDNLEFERLKEHFEPYLRSQTTASSGLHSSLLGSHSVNPVTAAASSALSREVPGISKFSRSRGSRGEKVMKEDLPEYRSRIEVGISSYGLDQGDEDVEFMRLLEEIGETAPVEQRWVSSWTPSLHSRDLMPLRMSLHSKKSKRCPTCRHILIKPEQKAQSTRYKIKLVASNYLPSIHAIVLNAPPAAANVLRKSASARPSDEDTHSVLYAGKTYPIRLSFSNPMYDSINIQLSVQRHSSAKSKPGFAVSLPTGGIPVGAYQEAWEYEDEDEVLPDLNVPGVENAPMVTADRDAKGRIRTIGIVDKKANIATIAGEVLIGKECQGDVKFIMNVSYTYRTDEHDSVDQTPGKAPQPKTTASDLKTFTFSTIVYLGTIASREAPRKTVVLDDTNS